MGFNFIITSSHYTKMSKTVQTSHSLINLIYVNFFKSARLKVILGVIKINPGATKFTLPTALLRPVYEKIPIR